MATQSISRPTGLALIFGPQAIGFDLDSFNISRARLVKDIRNKWALAAIEALPAEWNTISGSISTLSQYDGGKFLHSLNDLLKTDKLPSSTPFPNILLAPLVVADHLMSYLDFLRAAFPDLSDNEELPVDAKMSLETLGLSLGTLSAFAVSSSSTLSEVEKYGSVALRLAMIVGAVGDAEDMSRSPEDRALSFSAFWKSTELHNSMLNILQTEPDVSTLYQFPSIVMSAH